LSFPDTFSSSLGFAFQATSYKGLCAIYHRILTFNFTYLFDGRIELPQHGLEGLRVKAEFVSHDHFPF
jgi:hypothetical protein